MLWLKLSTHLVEIEHSFGKLDYPHEGLQQWKGHLTHLEKKSFNLLCDDSNDCLCVCLVI